MLNPNSTAPSKNDVIRVAILLWCQALAHLLCGTEIICTFLACSCTFLAILTARLGGLGSATTLMALIWWARHVGIGMALKILLGQSLESNLKEPIASYFMALATSAELLAAILLVRFVPIPGPIFRQINSLGYLSRLSIIATVIGTVLFLGASIRSYEDEDLAGIRQFQTTGLTLAVIARTVYVHKKSKGTQFIDIPLICILLSSIPLVMISGKKYLMFVEVLAYILTLVAVRGSVPWRAFAAASPMLLVIVVAITPIINALRMTRKTNDLTLSERVGAVAELIRSGDAFTIVSDANDTVVETDRDPPFDYFIAGSLRTVSERIALIQASDAVIPGIDTNGTMGWWCVTNAFERILPQSIFGERENIPSNNYVYWHVGLRPRTIRSDFVLGITGGAYAMAAWPGVLIVPFLIGFAFFVVQILWGGDSIKNPWAILFLIIHSHQLVEYDVTALITVLIRGIPLDLILFYSIHWLATVSGFDLEHNE